MARSWGVRPWELDRWLEVSDDVRSMLVAHFLAEQDPRTEDDRRRVTPEPVTTTAGGRGGKTRAHHANSPAIRAVP